MFLLKQLALLAPHDDVPGQPTNQWDAGQQLVEGAQGHPPTQSFGYFAKDALPVAILVGMNSIDEIIFQEKNKRGNPKLAVTHIDKVLLRQLKIGESER